jgi:hypothetical protein
LIDAAMTISFRGSGAPAVRVARMNAPSKDVMGLRESKRERREKYRQF